MLRKFLSHIRKSNRQPILSSDEELNSWKTHEKYESIKLENITRLINRSIHCLEARQTSKSLRGCLYGGGPALLVGLVLVRGQDFTSRLHGKSQPS